jgi:hypothetical protein
MRDDRRRGLRRVLAAISVLTALIRGFGVFEVRVYGQSCFASIRT